MESREQSIGLFWGSDTGATDGVAEELLTALKPHFNIEGHEIYRVESYGMAEFDFLILGLSTWHDGELQSDWDAFFDDFCTIDFSGKTVAFFGLGDQVGYTDYFVDGMGILAAQVEKAGGTIVGKWPTDEYDFDSSKAVCEEGWFYGLAIDEEFQPEMTADRIETWVQQIIPAFQEAMGSVVPSEP